MNGDDRAGEEARSGAEILVLGMGNTLVADDGVGIYAAREALKRLSGSEAAVVDVLETALAGPNLITLLSGYKHALVVDALNTRDAVPGRVVVMEMSDLAPSKNTTSPHSLNLFTAVEMGKRCGLPMPEEIRIVAVEILDITNVQEELTPPVAEALPGAVDAIMQIVRDWIARL